MNRWDRINPNLCWRNIWIVPYPNFGNWWKVARVQLRGRIFFLKKGILWYPVGNLLLYVFSTIEASGTILDRYSRNLLFLMHYFRNFKPHFLRFAKGSFNNYVDRILQFFWPHPLAWIVFIPGAWTKTYFFYPLPPPRSYWMTLSLRGHSKTTYLPDIWKINCGTQILLMFLIILAA